MGKFFDIDSPLMQFLNKVADLMLLNLLTLICCIPLITAGAALTAAHYVVLKMRRNEEGYIAKDFFKSFKLNFRQSTLIWWLMLIILVILGADYLIVKYQMIAVPDAMKGVLIALAVLYLFLLVWVFPVQAKFINTVARTIKNAFAISLIQIPRTVAMIIMYALPCLLLFISLRLVPVVLLFGITVPMYVSAMMYDKVFKGFEEKILESQSGEEADEGDNEDADGVEKIFSDKPMIDEGTHK